MTSQPGSCSSASACSESERAVSAAGLAARLGDERGVEEKRLESKLCRTEATGAARQATRWMPREAYRAAGSALSASNNTDPVQLVSFTIFTALLRAGGMAGSLRNSMDGCLAATASDAG